jgi:histidinol phosphatase-like PHP family hydrolase
VIDLHTHSLLSDGDLLPEELIRRCEDAGYRYLVIADHVGLGNCREVVETLVRVCQAYARVGRVKVFPGAEVTHVHPQLIPEAVAAARDAGARIVVGHGETIVEPVAPGTNAAFIRARVDVLAHPGLISEDDARAAACAGVRLEISGRKGHSLANGHVAALARAAGAALSFGSDGHSPGDYPTRAEAEKIMRGAGLTPDAIHGIFSSAEALLSSLGATP